VPQIPVYDEHVQAQGGIGVQSNANDFGGQVGDAEQGLGSAVEGAGEQVRKVENDQGRMWAYNAASKAYTGLQQQFTAKANALDPNDPQFNDKFKALQPDFQTSIDSTTSDLMGQAPNRMAARVLASHMAANGESLMRGAASQQAQVFAAKTQFETQQGMEGDQTAIASDPSNDNYQRLVDNRVASIGALETIGPEQKLKFQQMVRHGMAQTQVDVIASTDPGGFLQAVGAGGGRTTMQGFTHGAVPGVTAAPADPNAPPADASAPAAPGPAPMPDGITADNSPAAQSQRLQQNISDLRVELARPQTTPANRAILQTELDKNLAASVTTPANATLPQVQALNDSDIAKAAPAINGWNELTWPERVAAVRKAEANVGGNLASDRGTMDRDLRDAQVSLMAGKSFDGLDGPRFTLPNMQRLYGPDEGGRRFQQLEYVKQVGGFISQMTTMPTAQAAQQIQQLEPQGGSGEAEKAPLYHQAVEAFQRLGKMRDDDYMGWAQNNQVGGVQPLDTSTPNALAASVRARLPIAIAGRTDYQADAHVLSKGEVDQVGDMLNASNPAAQMAYVKALRTGLNGSDEWFADTVHQIAPKNTTLMTAAAVSMHSGTVQTDAGPQDSNTVGQYILEGAHILQGKDLDEKTSNGRAFKIDDGKFASSFWQAVGPEAFQRPDSTLANSAASDTYQAVKNYYAADAVHRGLDPSVVNDAAVQSAVRAVTGGVVDGPNNSRLFTPWGVPPDQFKDEFLLRAQGAIRQAGVTSQHTADQYRYINVDEGKYGVTFGGSMLTGADGKPVVVDFNKFFGTVK
jgi:hypothetical protein